MNRVDRVDATLLRPPLDGVRVIELAAIGPAPFCGMMLADHGADVIRIDRPGGSDPLALDQRRDVLLRSRRSITLDLKRPENVEIVAKLVETADGLIEGFRPGVAERLGLGPDVLMQRNPRLVYARMTGWGQSGPLSDKAGHDLNYISLSGCLAAIGSEGQPPAPPLNLIGDYGGGGMMLAFGFVTALLAARQSGVGRIIDCSMADGAAAMMAGMWSLKHNDLWVGERGDNLLDGGAPFYGCYACADGDFRGDRGDRAEVFRQVARRAGPWRRPVVRRSVRPVEMVGHEGPSGRDFRQCAAGRLDRSITAAGLLL